MEGFLFRRKKEKEERKTGCKSCIAIQSAPIFRREMKSSTLYLTLFLIIFVLVVNIDAAAVGKGGGVGGGGRSAKGKE